MIKKGEWFKFITIFTICFLALLPFAQLRAQGIEPPGVDTGRKVLDKTASTSKSFLGRVGEKIKNWLFAIVPFLEHINSKIANWWNNSAKPWFIEAYNSLIFFWNKEVVIK